MREHISGQFDAELDAVRTHAMEMGGVVEALLRDACDALINRDSELAIGAIERDAEVNRLELLIDEECNRIIARRQPTAGDLRLVMSIVKSIPDLERIGDEAQRIAKMAAELSDSDAPRLPMPELHEMIRGCRENLRDALDAFARVAVEEAVEIMKRDREIDTNFNLLVEELVSAMERSPEQVRPLLAVIWSARALERIGDHAKNLCEYVVYLGSGEDVRHTHLASRG